MRAPICIEPSLMRWPPNQSVAILARWMTNMTDGNMNAIRRPTPSATLKRSSLAPAKRSALEGVADKGPDDPDAGDLLAQHLVDAVDPHLHEAEQGPHPRDDEHDDDGEQGDEDDEERSTAVRSG